MMTRLATLLSALALTACSVIGDRSGTEEPRYTVTDRAGTLEIRTYGTRLAAETVIEADEEAARNAGFRRLAGYIFGANTARAKIAMTAPVAQGKTGETIAMTAPVAQSAAPGGRWTIRFFLPQEWTLERLPIPDDPSVRIVTVPAETYAVLGFTGNRGAAAIAGKQAELAGALAGSAWTPTGAPVAWLYDPPWTLPWLRRNEVAVTVARK